jgi:hypothetical protein
MSQTLVGLEGDQKTGVIKAFSFNVEFRDAAHKQEFLDLLQKKWGKPRPTRIGEGLIKDSPLGKALRYGPVGKRTFTVATPISGKGLAIEVS